MIKKLWAIAIVLFIGISNSQASHILGSTISFQCLGGSQYMISLAIYQDCAPGAINPGTSFNLNVEYATNLGANLWSALPNITVYQRPGTGLGTQVIAECETDVSQCFGGSRFGMRLWMYDGIFTVPSSLLPSQQHFRFKYTDCCRGSSVQNLNNPGGDGVCVTTYMNHQQAPCNNSPFAPQIVLPAFCVNDPVEIQLNVVEFDKDSLSFSLLTPKGQTCLPLTYKAPYTTANPFNATSPITINSKNGNVSFRTNTNQISVFGMRIDEYRTGITARICSLEIDALIQISAGKICDAQIPKFSPTTYTVNCEDSIFKVRLLKPISCRTVDKDGSCFRITKPNGQSLRVIYAFPENCVYDPSAKDTITSSIIIKVAEPMYGNNLVFKMIVKAGFDGNTMGNFCGKFMNEFDSVSIRILPNCYEYQTPMTMLNNTVDTVTDEGHIVRWNAPVGFDNKYFKYYRLWRTQNPANGWEEVESFTDTATLKYVESSPPFLPADKSMLYAVTMVNKFKYEIPMSDSISTIKLWVEPTDVPDSLEVGIKWTPFIGWPIDEYRVQMAKDGTKDWDVIGTTPNSDYLFTKPIPAGKYILRVYSVKQNAADSLISYSNVVKYEVSNKKISIPNVFTPNGDGINETFFIKNLRFYAGSHLTVYDRWGLLVYSSDNYKNDWGPDAKPGTYHFVFKQKKLGEFLPEVRGTLRVIRD